MTEDDAKLVERLWTEAVLCLRIAQQIVALRRQLDPSFSEPDPTVNSGQVAMLEAALAIPRLSRELAEVRKATIEECAKVAGAYCGTRQAAGIANKIAMSIGVAQSIRSLAKSGDGGEG